MSPRSGHLISSSKDKTIKIWNFVTGSNIRTIDVQPSHVKSLVISKHLNLIASASGDGNIKLWNYQRCIEPEQSTEEDVTQFQVS